MVRLLKKSKGWLSLAVVLSFIICSASPLGLAGERITTSDWEEDFEYLIEKLPESHKNLYANISQSEFRKKAESLKRRIPQLSRNEILVEISRLVASVGDAHTTIAFEPSMAYPFSFRWFEDGIVNLMTVEKHSHTLNKKLVAINGVKIDEVVSALSEAISHENRAWIKKMVPQYLVFTAYLDGLGIVEMNEPARFTFADKNGDKLIVEAVPFDPTSKVEFVKNYEYSPQYLKNKGEYYWYEYLNDEATLYFKYNLCMNKKDKPLSVVTEAMLSSLEEKDVKKVIIDLRGNGGGNSGLLNSFIEGLHRNGEINRKGRIFVLVDRNTFSSAVINAIDLKNKTEAILVGEPTGGKPNHYGEVRYFNLPNTGLRVFYSTKYFEYVEGDPASLFPDRQIKLSLQDFLNNRDPVLEAIIS